MSTGISPQPQDEILKLVIYRPHDNIWFKNPVRNILKKQLLPNKYAPFLDYLLDSEHKVYFTTKLYVDGGLKNLIKAAVEPFELLLWCMLNGINIKRVAFIFTKNALEDKDVLILMHYGTFTHEDASIAAQSQKLAKYLSSLSLYKLVHMTHYAYNPTIGSKNLGIFKPDLLVAENNLALNSDFYSRYFSNVADNFYQLPYVSSARFNRKAPFRERINKMVVSGSITFKMKDLEFKNFYKTDELQPLRRSIYERADKYTSEIKSLISDLNASRAGDEKIKSPSFIQKLMRYFLNKHPQLNYYKQDIVAVYNSHMMFAVPEEICNLPAIGFVEGMACGCAFFGLDDPMYRDLGLIPGVHYVTYDGSESDLIQKVQFYQSRTEELEKIANNGFEFVQNHLTPQIVYKKLLRKIEAGMACRT
jgi:glycosyltransferase involved in cell wall biosynthesis